MNHNRSGKSARGSSVFFVACGLLILASCSRFYRGEQARADEIKKLSHQSFAEVAEPGRCQDGCVEQEAGFAFAKKNEILQADNCFGKGDEDFIEGCRQYAENIDEAYHREVYGR